MESRDRLDVLFVNPGNAQAIYQGLADRFSAIEPPTWALLLAEAMRSRGHSVNILDVNAENLDVPSAAARILDSQPRLVCFVVYGQNVNAGTVGMSGAVALAEKVKSVNPATTVAFIGSYVQALPRKTLEDEASIDFVFTNEGVYALDHALRLPSFALEELSGLRGIAWRKDSGEVVINSAESVVPTSRMDEDLPGYAWDLLPYRESPLDLYRSPLWHAEYDEEKRSPYAAIQTSLGCNFGCSFCMINIINRDDEAEVGVASNYSGMRFWSPEFMIKQFDQLAEMGVRTIRIVDEMFLLYKKYYEPLCELLAAREYAPDLRMWAYSRIDTVRNPEILSLVRRAGIRWLALGIESASKEVRLEVSKGKFEDVDIHRVIEQIHEADIDVMANYIVGLTGDTHDTIRATLELAKELGTAGWNCYPAMALPGSELYMNAIESGIELPSNYTEFSFHSYDTIPLGTDSLTPAEVLKFRDEAFIDYHASEGFLNRVQDRFGDEALRNIEEMNNYRMRRRLVEEAAS